MIYAAHVLVDRIKFFALYTKHKGFDEEREWRLCFIKERDQSGLYENFLQYHVTPSGIQTKMKCKLSELTTRLGVNLSLPQITDRILLGPSISNYVSIRAVQRILELHGMKELVGKVRPSTIPLRPVQ